MPRTSRRRSLLTIPLLLLIFLLTLAAPSFEVFNLTPRFPGLVAIMVLVISTGMVFSYFNRPVLGTLMALFAGFFILGGGLFPAQFPLAPYAYHTPVQIQETATAFLLLSFIGILGLYTAYMVYRHRTAMDVVLFGLFILGVEIAYSKNLPGLYAGVYIFISLILLSTCKLEELLQEQDSMPGPRHIFSFRWTVWTSLITLLVIFGGLVLPATSDGVLYGFSARSFIDGLLGREQVEDKKKTAINMRDEEGTSWVRLENFELKGKVKLSQTPFMTVKSPEPFFWRGEISDYYTGRGWRNTFPLSDERDMSVLLDPPWDRSVQTRKVEAQFKMAEGTKSTVVFSALSPVEVKVPTGKYRVDEGGNIYSAQAVEGGEDFWVTSEVPEINERKLRASGSDYPRNIRENYLQLPEDLPAKVKNLARSITANAGNPYDKALAVEKYVQKNYPYTLDVDQTPEGRDVTDFFLSDLKKGYCTYHSTAMAVMLRSVGVPTRWVKGFTTGRKQSGDTYLVSNDNAHAWVEVYFDGFGWLPFEPTSSFALPETALKVQGGPDAKAGTKKNDTSGSSAGATTNASQKSENTVSKLWLIPILAVLLVAGGLLFRWWKRRPKKPRFSTVQEAKGIYHALLAVLLLRGFPREEDQTPNEYAATVENSRPELGREVRDLTNGYLREKYSTNKLSQEEIMDLLVIWKALYKKLVPESDIDKEKNT